MRTFCALALMIILQLSRFNAEAQDMNEYSSELYKSNGDSLRYRLLMPANYDMHKSYPLIIFLHGAGERGSDNAAQLLHGGSLFLKDSIRQQYPAFVLFPQCPQEQTWAPLKLKRDSSNKVTGLLFSTKDESTVPGRLVKSLLDSLLTTGKIDSKRVYIGGLSLGGMGTFDLLTRYPEVFAAGFPICGAGDAATAGRFAKVPVWIFHGGDDKVVPVTYSRDYYKALKDLGADVKYTEYPGVGHNSWDNAFAEPGLIPWLFSNKKSD